MKYKIIPISDHIIFDDKCIQFLEDLSLKGWKLKKVGTFFFIFEKCSQPFKYQIDYNLPSDEYMEITQEMGYTYIGNYNAIHFFINENLDAIDLQTDEEAHKLSVLKIYSLGSLFLSLALSFFIGNFAFFILQSSYVNLDPASFYIHFNLFVLSAILLLGALIFLLNAIQVLIKRLYMQERIAHQAFKVTKMISLLCKIILAISVIILIYFLVFLQGIINIFFFILLFAYILFLYIVNRYSFRQKSIEKRRIIQTLMTSICAIFVIIISNKIPEPIIKNENAFYTYTSESTEINRNLFLNNISTIGDNYFEDYYSCLNSSIAKSVLQKCAIDVEHQTRLPSNEEIDQMAYEGKNYNMYDIPFVSYNKAIQIFDIYQDNRVDECYYTSHTLLIRKNHIVVKCYIEDKSKINQIIEHYFIDEK